MSVLTRISSRYSVATDPLRTERRVELAALVLLFVILLQLLWIAARAALPVLPAPIMPAADSLAVSTVSDTGGVSSADSAEVQNRPLFWASRRAVDMPAGSDVTGAELLMAAEPARELKDLDVTGIYGSGDTGGAIVSYKGKQRRVAVGDEVDGWTLHRVEHGEVVWVSGGREDRRRLLPQPVVAMAPAPAPVVVPDEARASVARKSSAATDAVRKGRPGNSNKEEPGLSLGGLALGGGPTKGKDKR